MGYMKPVQRGHYVGRPQFEEGKTELSLEQYKVLRELSYVLGNGYDNQLQSLLPHYTFKGLIDWLYTQVETLLTNDTIDERTASAARELIAKLIHK